MIRSAAHRLAYLGHRSSAGVTSDLPGSVPASTNDIQSGAVGRLNRLCNISGYRRGPVSLILLSVGAAVSGGLLTAVVFPAPFACLSAVVCGNAPFAWLRRRAEERATTFASDYAAVLLATASGVRAGLPPLEALDRATATLPSESTVRAAVERLKSDLAVGCPREVALQAFGANIELPEITLFRGCFLLALEHGGRVTPSLQRLAQSTYDRLCLIEHARVVSTSMRLTANVILVLAPIFVGVVALRTPEFVNTLMGNTQANTIAGIGVSMFLGGYLGLRALASFKP